MSTVLITGVNGQDGSYLAEFLLLKGYHVVGTTSNRKTDLNRILHIRERLEIVEADLLDQGLVEDILRKYEPDEVYNLAARASCSELWTEPVLTGELNALTVARILEAIRRIDHNIRFVQASSSEMFGNATETPQTETTPIRPRNSYGVAKAYGHWITANYREHHKMFACSSILYNHESPRRGLELVSRKITHAVARIKLGLARELRLGNLEARRDRGFAGDYVQAMWLMTQQPKPDDYVIATGETYSVRDFCALAFAHVGLDYKDFVKEDFANYRQPEIALLVGNPEKAHSVLGWEPTVTFQGLVGMMVDADLRAVRDLQRHQNAGARC
jgi:GDPmannose 4,6-dehydratase